jgi:phosphatidylserine decarboxylase
VKLLKHVKGKFLSPRREEAPFVNERHTTVIEDALLDVAVAQVASWLVRRVEGFLALNETVSEGQRLGVITLSPLMAVLLPVRAGLTVEVKPGARVTCRHLRAGTPGRRWGRASS